VRPASARAGWAMPSSMCRAHGNATVSAMPGFERILHIEDSETDAFIVKRGLRKVPGLSLDWVTTGEQGLERARKGGFDLVLLDYALPDMTGLEVLVRIQELANAPPVVMVSGFGSEYVAVRGMTLGAIGYVNKDTPDFKDNLSDLLDQFHQENQDRRDARQIADRLRAAPGARKKMEEVLDDLARSLRDCRGTFVAGIEGFPIAVSGIERTDGARGQPAIDVLAAMAGASITRNLDVVGGAMGLKRPTGGMILHERGSLLFHPVRGVGNLVVVLDREAVWSKDGKELAQAAREIETVTAAASA